MRDSAIYKKLEVYGADARGIVDRFMDDEEFYLECLASFFESGELTDLGNAVKQKDYAAAFVAAHSLKGLSGNMGLTPLYKTVCAMVEALRAKNYDNLDAQYKAVAADYDVAKKLL